MKKIEIKIYEFDELDEEAQERVINETVDFIIQTTDFENLNKHSNLYKAYKKANDLHTIWFLGQYIWEMCKDEVLGTCKQNYYLINGEIAQYLLLETKDNTAKIDIS